MLKLQLLYFIKWKWKIQIKLTKNTLAELRFKEVWADQGYHGSVMRAVLSHLAERVSFPRALGRRAHALCLLIYARSPQPRCHSVRLLSAGQHSHTAINTADWGLLVQFRQGRKSVKTNVMFACVCSAQPLIWYAAALFVYTPTVFTHPLCSLCHERLPALLTFRRR